MYVGDHIRYIFETTNGQIVCVERAMYGKGYSTVYRMTEVVVPTLRPLAETRDRFLSSRGVLGGGGEMAAGGERIWCPRERATYLLPGCLTSLFAINTYNLEGRGCVRITRGSPLIHLGGAAIEIYPRSDRARRLPRCLLAASCLVLALAP